MMEPISSKYQHQFDLDFVDGQPKYYSESISQKYNHIDINPGPSLINFSSVTNELELDMENQSKIIFSPAILRSNQCPPNLNCSEDGLLVQLLPDQISSILASLEELPLRLPLWGVVILAIAYSVLFICGVIGNCSVLFVVIKLRKMKTLVNIFIFNLAVADLLGLFFCLLPNLVSNIFVPWVLGLYLCKIVPYIQGVSVCASIYSLLAISVERCIAIQWPFKHLVTKDKAKLIILGIWLWSFIVPIPWALVFQLGNFDEENPHHEFCIEVWPEDYADWGNYYFLFGNLLICYVFPLAVILISYVTIYFRVYRRKIPSDSYHKAMELIHQKSKTTVLRIIIIIVIIFAISYFPLYLIISWLKFGPQERSELETDIISFVLPFAQWLISFQSCSNALIYSFLNHKFRKAFAKILNQGCWGNVNRQNVTIKHKSPTVNILLKRFSSNRVETTVSNNNNNFDIDSSESI